MFQKYGNKVFFVGILISIFPYHKQNFLYASAQRNVPEFVYYATPTKPEKIFEFGIRRERNSSVNLSLNIDINFQNLEGGIFLDESTLGQIGNPSIFVRTTSIREQALNNELAFINPNPNPFNPSSQSVHEIFPELYVYQIVPQRNFVDLSYTYENALNQLRHTRESWENLDLLRDYYTGRNEYAAIAGIGRSTIRSAARFQYFPELGHYAEVEIMQNHHYNPEIQAAISPLQTNNLGVTPSAINVYGRSSVYYCNMRARAAQRSSMKKRSTDSSNIECSLVKKNVKKIDFIQMPEIEMPEKIFKDNSFEIKVTAYSYNDTEYCLVQKNKYIYTGYCDATDPKKKWIYTEFGQLIADVSSSRKSHYFCLTAPSKDNSDQYPKMEICDLNKQEQKWTFKSYKDAKHTITSHSGSTIGLYDYYGYLIETNEKYYDYYSLKILNFKDLQKKISKPFIQFSTDPILITKKPGDEKTHYYINPEGSSAYFSSKKEGNQNYYNAHNNSLFSSNGHGTGSDSYQVCYYSGLLKNQGSSYNWVYNNYCSSQNRLEPHFRWYFNEGKTQDTYHIIDTGENKLRASDNSSLYSYYAYNAGNNFYDSSSFSQNFKLGQPEKIFAHSYSNVVDNKRKEIVAFHSLYDYFSKLNTP